MILRPQKPAIKKAIKKTILLLAATLALHSSAALANQYPNQYPPQRAQYTKDTTAISEDVTLERSRGHNLQIVEEDFTSKKTTTTGKAPAAPPITIKKPLKFKKFRLLAEVTQDLYLQEAISNGDNDTNNSSSFILPTIVQDLSGKVGISMGLNKNLRLEVGLSFMSLGADTEPFITNITAIVPSIGLRVQSTLSSAPRFYGYASGSIGRGWASYSNLARSASGEMTALSMSMGIGFGSARSSLLYAGYRITFIPQTSFEINGTPHTISQTRHGLEFGIML